MPCLFFIYSLKMVPTFKPFWNQYINKIWNTKRLQNVILILTPGPITDLFIVVADPQRDGRPPGAVSRDPQPVTKALLPHKLRNPGYKVRERETPLLTPDRPRQKHLFHIKPKHSNSQGLKKCLKMMHFHGDTVTAEKKYSGFNRNY